VTKDIIAMLLAGGVGSRLNILARHRAKPAIVFGGIYRIIDFTMSNVANSLIDVVGVLTQYKPLSLMVHLENGRPWDLFGRTRIVEILPPKTGEEISDWYKGTSDAVHQNLGFIEDFSPELVLVVSGDHIYHMNYNELISFHKEKNAEATICLIRVPLKDASQFGLAEIDDAKRIINWTEKPLEPKTDLASMGVYIFNKDVLVKIVTEVAQRGGVDFAKDVVPVFLKRKKVYGFEFRGYWRDVGTIDAYWNANMDMLRKNSGLTIEDWKIKTNLSVKGEVGDRPSTYFGRWAEIRNSLIARGCVIEGTVQNSILSPGVKISQNTTVSDSIIFHDTMIRSGSVIEKCIIDKSVTIKENIHIGEGPSIPNKKFPHHLFTGITLIGKGATIGSHMTIGKNCIIEPDALLDKMSRKDIRSGTTA
jgi:glucose-1-phosphate adenylyltransferase